MARTSPFARRGSGRTRGLGRARGDRRWGEQPLGSGQRPPTSLVVALVMACASLMVLDTQAGDSSPVEPVRRAVGEVVGPAESAVAAAVRPAAVVPQWFRSHSALRADVDALEAENAELLSQVRTAGYDRNRLAELEGLTSSARDLGQALVPARVVGFGPSQSFTGTVTIDAGSSSGLGPDMTVVNDDGLVGRVLRVTSTTATVLLVVDSGSTVGARVGESMEMGFLRGRGEAGEGGDLDLELVDAAETPAKDDTVVTWGSRDGSPYAAGIPIGRVTAVYESLRESTKRVVVEPFVDVGSLDVVGVVVPSGTESDRGLVEADGSLR
ncbi:rod shape-determining protein MreC [Nocardioides sp. AX2bis]|uniref:rod shape-determining protein MreC n=1 Tax=Nocardioides sp. AX2bis TaxID=2653157 RepID=UPI0012F04FD9|nr:rod shape-determining protein MreC [Nocardioides sp. AX2bis]VXB85567.1 Cell shape-determining protein MreC [Nocardioides sp. AX2bis]